MKFYTTIFLLMLFFQSYSQVEFTEIKNFIYNFYDGKNTEHFVQKTIISNKSLEEGLLQLDKKCFLERNHISIDIDLIYIEKGEYIILSINDKKVKINIEKHDKKITLLLDKDNLFDLMSVMPELCGYLGVVLIDIDRQLGKEWLIKAIKNNSQIACHALVKYGLNSSKDYETVRVLLDSLSLTSFPIADYRDIYYYYSNKEKDLLNIYLAAAKTDNEIALMWLGKYFTPSKDGQNFPEEYSKKIHLSYYTRAASLHNNEFAMINLGGLYKNNHWGVPMNLDSAVYWYEQSVEYGSYYGLIFLCEYYGQGKDGYKVDKMKYEKYINKIEKYAKETNRWNIAEYLGDFYSNRNYDTYDKEKALFYYELSFENDNSKKDILEKILEVKHN